MLSLRTLGVICEVCADDEGDVFHIHHNACQVKRLARSQETREEGASLRSATSFILGKNKSETEEVADERGGLI